VSERHRRPHGDGSLHRRVDGKWVGVLDLGYIDGRRRRKYVYADTEREALAKLRGQRRALERGQDILASVPTLGAWLTEWLTMKEAEGRRALTLRGYRMLARKHIEPALGRIRLDRLKPSDVRHVLESKTAAGLAPATVRHIHGLIRNALADAERHELIARNVAKAVRPPSIRRHEQRFLTIEEAKRLVDVVKGDRLEALAHVLLRLGLRRGEALALRWDGIDLDDRALRIEGSLTRAGSSVVHSEGKTASSNRTIPLIDPLPTVLIRHRARQSAERLAAGELWNDGGWVFTTELGTALDPSNAYHWWQRLTERAGIGRRRMHAARHTAATLMLDQGVPLELVSAVLGHAGLAITADVYARPTADAKRRALEALSGRMTM